MSRAVRVVLALFAILYAAALALLVVGTFGLFGQDRGPLAGVLLIPIGLPWNLIVGGWIGTVFAPAINFLIIAGAGMLVESRNGARADAP